MLSRVIRVTALPKYRLVVEFDDGVSGTIELAGELTGPAFEPLRDELLFHQVMIDDFGAVCWPKGPDLAPDAMHSELVDKRLDYDRSHNKSGSDSKSPQRR